MSDFSDDGPEPEGFGLVFNVALVNYDPLERVIKVGSVKLTVRLDDIESEAGVLFVTPKNTLSLEMNRYGNKITVSLPDVTTGGFLFIGKGF